MPHIYLECPACGSNRWTHNARCRHICRECELVPNVDITYGALVLIESFGDGYFRSQFLPAEFVADHIDDYAEDGE